MPAPRILEGPFRNVDPHTASLAVYFRGPASELFNMLNPESPGAISALARSYSGCVDARPARLCVCENIRVWVYVRAIYYEDEREWNGHIPAGAASSRRGERVPSRFVVKYG